MSAAVIGVRQRLPGVVYPPEADLRRYVEAGALTNDTLARAYCDAFHRYADRVAIDGRQGRMTYRELDARSDRLAAALMVLGVKPLDRALFQVANSPELLVAIFASLKAGVIPVCTLTAHREHEIGELGRRSEASVYFVQGDDPKFDYPAFAVKMAAEIATMRHVVVVRGPEFPGTQHMDALIASADRGASSALVAACVALLDPFQVALFQLSGGTTGVAKIIPRFSNDYLYNMRRAWEHTRRDAVRDADGHSTVVTYSAGPYLHNAGFVIHWGPTLLHGGTLLVSSDFSEDGLLSDFQTYRPNWAFLPTPLLVRLAAARKRAGVDFPYLQAVASRSAPMVRDKLGAPGYPQFGMAEGQCILCREGHPQQALDDTVGEALSPLDDIVLVDPGTETPVADGKSGEMLVKGPYTLHGYYNGGERNKESFTASGYYRTGDLMRRHIIDGAVYYSYEGRAKDIVKRGGESISCEEVELALRDYPGLADVAIVAMPDPVYDERACAFVILEPGAQPPSIASFGRHLEQHGLSKLKWPERIEVVNSFPLTKAEKLDKPALRKQIADTLAREARGAAN